MDISYLPIRLIDTLHRTDINVFERNTITLSRSKGCVFFILILERYFDMNQIICFYRSLPLLHPNYDFCKNLTLCMILKFKSGGKHVLIDKLFEITFSLRKISEEICIFFSWRESCWNLIWIDWKEYRIFPVNYVACTKFIFFIRINSVFIFILEGVFERELDHFFP